MSERKVAFVTGAGSGIGRATAGLFAARGYATMLADLNETGGRETEAAIRAAGGEATFVSCNVADDASVQLEAGNIAAAAGDEANARSAWGRVIELSPGSPIATSARKALEQFGATEK